MMPSEPKLLVFDLDGTLIDSRVDLCNSVNATLVHFGKEPLPEDVIAGYIGDGATTLVRRAFAHSTRARAHPIEEEADSHDDAFVEEAHLWFIGYYRVHKLDATYVYDGVMEALAAIRAARPALPMAVLTNKPVYPSREICRHFGLDQYFFANYGGNSFTSKKPDPEGFLRLVAEAGVRVEECVMIGDSHVDVETARACGAGVVGCLYGLSPETLVASGADVMVGHPKEWFAALRLG